MCTRHQLQSFDHCSYTSILLIPLSAWRRLSLPSRLNAPPQPESPIRRGHFAEIAETKKPDTQLAICFCTQIWRYGRARGCRIVSCFGGFYKGFRHYWYIVPVSAEHCELLEIYTWLLGSWLYFLLQASWFVFLIEVCFKLVAMIEMVPGFLNVTFGACV